MKKKGCSMLVERPKAVVSLPDSPNHVNAERVAGAMAKTGCGCVSPDEAERNPALASRADGKRRGRSYRISIRIRQWSLGPKPASSFMAYTRTRSLNPCDAKT